MTDLDSRWAWSKVEAMADGSLSRDEKRRMRAVLEREPELSAAVARARTLRRALRRLGKAPVPRSLHARLLKIPAQSGDRSRAKTEVWSWTSATAAASAMVAALVLLTQPEPADDPRAAALRDFELAMTYLHRSYEIAGGHLKRTLERELKEAFRVNTGSGANDADTENGG